VALESGTDATRSIALALNSTQDPYFTQHVSNVQAVIARGGQFHEALQKTGAFPSDFLHALQNAEMSGTESESLSRMSSEYQRQAEAASTALTVIASLIIWGLVAALLIFMIISLFLNLYLKPYQEAFEML
jgi:type II secretory pathway component PulF